MPEYVEDGKKKKIPYTKKGMAFVRKLKKAGKSVKLRKKKKKKNNGAYGQIPTGSPENPVGGN